MCRYHLLIVGLLTFSVSNAWADDRDAIVFGYNNASAYPYLAGSGPRPADPPGLSVELVRFVAEQLDLSVRFERMPGMRVLHSLGVGKLDGAFLFSYRKERTEFGAYPIRDGKPDSARRLATLGYILYRRPGVEIDWNGEEFRNFQGRIGANLNYSVVADLRKMDITVTEGRSTAHSFRMLFADRVTAVADQEVVADSYLATIDHPPVEKVSPPLSRKAYYLLFSYQFIDKYPETAERFWAAIARHRDAFLASIAHRYTTAQD